MKNCLLVRQGPGSGLLPGPGLSSGLGSGAGGTGGAGLGCVMARLTSGVPQLLSAGSWGMFVLVLSVFRATQTQQLGGHNGFILGGFPKGERQ